MSKKLLEKYHSRLLKECFIKALMLGLTVGFCVLLITSAVWWLAGLKYFWLCAIFFVAATAGAIPIFYFTRLPGLKQTARRIDALGLEERTVTMAELEGETAFIALKQREDAVSNLKKVNSKLIKITVSISLIVTLAIAAVSGTGMMTVAGLAHYGIIKSGKDIIDDPENKEFEIYYDVDGEGVIEGETFQTVAEGSDASAVRAIPAEGWMFLGWSDGLEDPYRLDTNVSEDIAVFVIFEELDEEEDEEDDGEPQGLSDNFDSEFNEEGTPQPKEGTGRYEPSNQYLDGKTFIGDDFEQARNDIIKDLSQGKNTDQEADATVDYLDLIAESKEDN